jgi:hypothetical protein
MPEINEDSFSEKVRLAIFKKNKVRYDQTDPLMVIPTMIDESINYLSSSNDTILESFREKLTIECVQIVNEAQQLSRDSDAKNTERAYYLANEVLGKQNEAFQAQLGEFKSVLRQESSKATRQFQANLQTSIKACERLSIINSIIGCLFITVITLVLFKYF